MVAPVTVMKCFGIAIFGILFAGVAVATPARVGRIIDGDTFDATVMLGGGIRVSARVRIRDVDTPEIHGACAYEREMALRAKARLADMLPPGAVVELTNIKDDKYLGRIDANVADTRGADVGKTLIRAGLGRPYHGGKRAGWCSSSSR